MITPERLFNTLYCRTNSESISRSERNRLKIDEDDFIYGEIEFASFVGVLEKLSLQSGGIFYDLGCGAGKAVLAAALNFDLSKSVGIELLPGLCEVANEKIQQAILILQSVKNELTDLYLKRLASIQIINADLHQCDIAEADIVFINATCFGYTNWEKIKEKLPRRFKDKKIFIFIQFTESIYFVLTRMCTINNFLNFIRCFCS